MSALLPSPALRSLGLAACASWLAVSSLALGAPPAEATVWIELRDPADVVLVTELGLGWDEARTNAGARFRLPADRLHELGRSGLSWSLLAEAAPAPDGYLSPSEHLAALQALAEEAPELVTLVELGQSAGGRPLVGVRLRGTEHPRAAQRIFGAHHGDEPVSAELALDAARRLVAAWQGADPELAQLLEEQEIFVLPVVNPDGLAADSRYNANDVDLNRNYDYEWSSASYRGGARAFSEPETRAVRSWSAWSGYGSGLSLHAGAANIGWVWNFTTEPSGEAPLLEALARTYAEDCAVDGFYITNGAEWYVTRGDTTDWAYGRLGTLDYTVELSGRKAPDLDTVDTLADAHWEGVRAFLLWPEVVSLQVVDASSGRGLPAQVTVVESGWPAWTSADGRWGRPVAESGAYTVEVSAPGFETLSLSLSTGAPPESVALAPVDLADWLPEQRILSRGGSGELWLPEAVGSLTLSRPGEEPVVAGAIGQGGWKVDLDRLSPGPWNLETDLGVLPRGLFVGDYDDGSALLEATLDEGVLVVDGLGFGPGSRAFTLWGDARPPVELTLLEEDEEFLRFEAGELAEVEGPVDLLVLSRGYQLAMTDLLGQGGVDTSAPLDTGTPDSGRGQQDTAPGDGGGGTPITPPRGCGCTSAGHPGYPGALGLLCLVSPLFRRRRP